MLNFYKVIKGLFKIGLIFNSNELRLEGERF